VLLPGDIEAPAERELARRLGDGLSAPVLVAPHHGSRSSSTRMLLEAAAPSIVLVPSGYRNRFGFPHKEVLGRYRARGIAVHDTGCSGAIRVRLRAGRDPSIAAWWPRARRFWHAPVTAPHCAAGAEGP
jgi:competence protein ComEC